VERGVLERGLLLEREREGSERGGAGAGGHLGAGPGSLRARRAAPGTAPLLHPTVPSLLLEPVQWWYGNREWNGKWIGVGFGGGVG